MSMTHLIDEELFPAEGDALVSPVLRCGDAGALRSPGPLRVVNAAWSRDRASVGDELELTAEVNGTDVSGLVCRVTNARGQAIATLPLVVTGTQARAKWRVPPFGDRGEQYDFCLWKGDQRLGGSDRLFVGPPADCELASPPAPTLQVVDGAKAARRYVHVGRVRAVPSRALQGDTVELRAFILCAADGDRVVFRIFRGDCKEPCAVVDGRVSGEFATAQWMVCGVEGGATEHGMDFVDFDLEAECADVGVRAHCIGELRGYRPQFLASEQS
jgi:hypothetical protein